MNRIRFGFVAGLLFFSNGFGIYAEDLTPDDAHVMYSQNKPYNWLNVYLAAGASTDDPTPVYIWAHWNGGTADDTPADLKEKLSGAGISLISWESVVLFKTQQDVDEAAADMTRVLDFVLKNASHYNFDTNRIVVGGQSRGSGACWDGAHQNPGLVKGIYSAQALPNGFWKSPEWNPLMAINSASPPLLFTYEDAPDTTDGHTPQNGFAVTNAYHALGIGERTSIEHSLKKRGINRWSFLVDFILKTTQE